MPTAGYRRQCKGSTAPRVVGVQRTSGRKNFAGMGSDQQGYRIGGPEKLGPPRGGSRHEISTRPSGPMSARPRLHRSTPYNETGADPACGGGQLWVVSRKLLGTLAHRRTLTGSTLSLACLSHFLRRPFPTPETLSPVSPPPTAFTPRAASGSVMSAIPR
jgi:hypothetical protein